MLPSNKNIIWSIVAGLLGGALFSLIMKGGLLAMIGICLSPLPLIMAGLSIGFVGATIASAVGLLLLSVLTSGEATIIYFAWDIAPSLLLVFLALKHRKEEKKTVWYPLGYMLSWLSLLTAGIALLTILAIVITLDSAIASTVSNTAAQAAVVPALDIETGLKALILKAMSGTLSSQIDGAAAMATIEKIVPIFMTMLAITWFLRIVFVAYITEYILLKKQKALRPRPSYTEIYVQNWTLGVVVAGTAIGYLASGNIGYISANLAACMAIPFCALGLSRIHLWAEQTNFAGILLLIFYTLMTLAFIFGLGAKEIFVLLAAIGLYEQLSRMYRTSIQKKMERK